MCTVAKGAEARRRSRLDFRRLPGPVFDPPRREALSGDECGLIFPNSGW